MTWRAAPRYDRAMKTRTLVLSTVLVVVVAGACGAWWLYRSLDDVVKRGIEHWGSEITGVTVRVDSVKIQVADGRATIRGLRVGNPKGFQAPHALTLDEMSLALDPASITRDVVVVRELLIAAPAVIYERSQVTDNLTAIQRNVDAWVAKNAGAKKSGGPGRKFILENVIVTDGKAHFGDKLSSPMPNLRQRDVGKKTNGATAGEAVKQVLGAMLRTAGELATRMGSLVKDGAPTLGDGVKSPLK